MDDKNELLEIAEEYMRLWVLYHNKHEDISHNDQFFLYCEFKNRVDKFKEEQSKYKNSRK